MMLRKRRQTAFVVLFLLLFTLMPLLQVPALAARDPAYVRVGIFEMNGFYQFGANYSLNGYGYDYLQEIKQYTDWKYDYVFADYNQCLRMLKEGKIDLMGSLQRSPEREEIFDFAQIESGISYGILATLDTNHTYAYEDFESFDGMIVATLDGNSQNDVFMRYAAQNGFSCQLVLCDSEKQMRQALISRRVDAILSSNLRKLENEKIIAKFNANKFYFATTKGNLSVLNALNAAQESVKLNTPYFDAELNAKYYSMLERQAAVFTRPEVAYVSSKPVIRVAYPAFLEPISYSKNGEFTGFSRYYFNLLSKKSDLNFEYFAASSYGQASQWLKEGSVDMMVQVLNGRDKANQDFLLTRPYSHTSVMLMGKPGASLHESTQVALTNSTFDYTSLLQKHYPYLHVTAYPSAKLAVEAARALSNCVTPCMLDLSSGLVYNAQVYANLSIVSTFPDQYPVCIAVSREANPLLVGILDKSILQVSEDEVLAAGLTYREQSAQNMSFSQLIKLFGAQIFTIVLILLLFSILFYYIITLQKQRQINRMAFVDPVTNGATIASFITDAEHLFYKHPHESYAILSADMDNFKFINDVFGYELGNELLLQTYALLKADLQPGELVARISADNFVLLLENRGEDILRARIDRMLEKISALLHGEKYSTEIVMSCGVLVIDDFAREENNNINFFIDMAGIARKRIKGNHQSTYCFFDAGMRERILNQKLMESKMAGALDKGEFVLYLQPKYCLRDGTLCGAEALVRWREQDGRVISPGEFIPLFEKNSFVTKLDFHILKLACHSIAQRIANGFVPLPISVNFSRLHLKDPNFVSELARIVDDCGVSRSLIEVELTESTMLDNEQKLIELLVELHRHGFLLSMDDFGSGYSSLGLLKSLPVDVIKLDRSFFCDHTDPVRAITVVSSIIDMAKKLGISTVAEGVETREHVALLRSLDCDIGQGYFYSRPIPADVFDAVS